MRPVNRNATEATQITKTDKLSSTNIDSAAPIRLRAGRDALDQVCVCDDFNQRRAGLIERFIKGGLQPVGFRNTGTPAAT